MSILEVVPDTELGSVYRLSDGARVFVNDVTVGYVGGHPSGVDYYRDNERGYGCESDREIALVFHTQAFACK